MRVLFIPGYRYPASLDEPLTSGDLRYTFNVSRAMARAGHEVAVLTRRGPGDPVEQRLDGVSIHRYRSGLRGLFPSSFDISIGRARAFRQLSTHADVVVANSPLTLELLGRPRNPLVYICSGLEDARNYGRSVREIAQWAGLKLLRDPFKRATWARSRRVNTTAEAEVGTLERMGVPAPKITAIGPGVEIERYNPESGASAAMIRERLGLAPNGGQRIVLSVSRFTPAKGLLETLRGFALLRASRQDVVLVLVGVRQSHRRDYLEQVEREIHQLGLESHVIVEQDIPEALLPSYYSAADVVSVFSIGYDPLPTVIIESMSCGTPVVATSFPPRQQFITHNETGMMVGEGAVGEWARAVDQLLANEALARRIRDAALDTVRERFDMNRVASQYIALFNTL